MTLLLSAILFASYYSVILLFRYSVFHVLKTPLLAVTWMTQMQSYAALCTAIAEFSMVGICNSLTVQLHNIVHCNVLLWRMAWVAPDW